MDNLNNIKLKKLLKKKQQCVNNSTVEDIKNCSNKYYKKMRSIIKQDCEKYMDDVILKHTKSCLVDKQKANKTDYVYKHEYGTSNKTLLRKLDEFRKLGYIRYSTHDYYNKEGLSFRLCCNK